MVSTTSSYSVYTSSLRQVNHWLEAAKRLAKLENLASGTAWSGIDPTMANILKESLQNSIQDVVSQAETLKNILESKPDNKRLQQVRPAIRNLRNRYLKAEETIHFYTIAINSRTTPGIAALLRACDILCLQSMKEVLEPLGKGTPYVLTYVDKGIGASILKAGLRLWDGKVSQVAAVKITQHNLYRPTAIIHETGHQVAHVLEWTEELAVLIKQKLGNHPSVVGSAFSGWTSEMAADAFAFVHTGFAAVAALNDVVSGSDDAVFAYHQYDPHPISYVRVLLNVEMCRQSFGSGPWDQLEEVFTQDYNIHEAKNPSIDLIRLCIPAIPEVAKILLQDKFNALGQRALSDLVPITRVSPSALERLAHMAGPALFTSHAWIWKECLRLLALTGYKIGLGEGDMQALHKQQEEWMTRLGFSVALN
jgi:hypothetical protein